MLLKCKGFETAREMRNNIPEERRPARFRSGDGSPTPCGAVQSHCGGIAHPSGFRTRGAWAVRGAGDLFNAFHSLQDKRKKVAIGVYICVFFCKIYFVAKCQFLEALRQIARYPQGRLLLTVCRFVRSKYQPTGVTFTARHQASM
jgi:hypothetical protein